MLLVIIIHLVCVCCVQQGGQYVQIRFLASCAIMHHFRTWGEAVEIARDTETKARIGGVSAQMTFDFFFGVFLGEMLLRHADNLSKTLQRKSISAAEGQQVGKMVIHTLQSLRTEDSYDLFWTKVSTMAETDDIDVEEPQLP